MKRLAQATAALGRRGAAAGLGQPGPLAPLCRTRIPWAAWFQFSCRYTVLFQFAVAVLAAIGFVLVEREAREKQKIQRHLPLLDGQEPGRRALAAVRDPGATVLVSLAVAVAGLILQSGHQVASPPRVLVGPLLMAAAALLVIAAAQGVRGALVGLILFMAADLGYYGLSCTLDEPGGKLDGLLAQIVAPPAAEGTARCRQPRCPAGLRPARRRPPANRGDRQSDDAGRLVADRRLCGPGAEQVVGLLPTAGLARGFHALGPPQPFDLGDRGPAPYDENWLQVPDPLPLVRLVTRVVPSDNPAEDLAKIDIRREALCEYALALPPGKPGTATVDPAPRRADRREGLLLARRNCW